MNLEVVRVVVDVESWIIIGHPWVFHRVAHGKVSDGLAHRVCATLRSADAARLWIPGAEPARCDLVALQVLNTAGTAGKNEDVLALAGDADMKQRAVFDFHGDRVHAGA